MGDVSDHTPFDLALGRLANGQHGVVALAQLKALGMSPSAVRTRASAGKLHRIHHGVYAVGHRTLTIEARWLAAVLACGRGAVLSHHSAAKLWGIRRTDRTTIDVTTLGRAGRVRKGIQAHIARRLAASDVTCTRAIPCTTVARTLLDLADVVDRRTLERALDRAEILQLFDGRAIEDVLESATGRRGAPILRSLLQGYEAGRAITESELEERFLALCADFGIPRPRVNAWIALDGGAVKVDFLWAPQRLIVETDGRQVHGTRRAFEQDRRRDQRLLLAGYRVAHCTWRQVAHQPEQIAATVSSLLDQ
jgi:hypothetical protein